MSCKCLSPTWWYLKVNLRPRTLLNAPWLLYSAKHLCILGKKCLWLSTKMNAVFILNVINNLHRLVNLSAKKLPDTSCQPEIVCSMKHHHGWKESFLSGNYSALKFIPYTSAALSLGQRSCTLQWAVVNAETHDWSKGWKWLLSIQHQVQHLYHLLQGSVDIWEYPRLGKGRKKM